MMLLIHVLSALWCNGIQNRVLGKLEINTIELECLRHVIRCLFFFFFLFAV